MYIFAYALFIAIPKNTDFDVEDGEEEEEDNCTDDEFFCDGRCLDKRLQCDGRIDCQSGEDEENCPGNSGFSVDQSVIH